MLLGTLDLHDRVKAAATGVVRRSKDQWSQQAPGRDDTSPRRVLLRYEGNARRASYRSLTGHGYLPVS